MEEGRRVVVADQVEVPGLDPSTAAIRAPVVDVQSVAKMVYTFSLIGTYWSPLLVFCGGR